MSFIRETSRKLHEGVFLKGGVLWPANEWGFILSPAKKLLPEPLLKPPINLPLQKGA